jgi:hypothetical protein
LTHNSWNRPRYFIRFANLPLWQFVVDVTLVGVYWFTATSAEGTGTDLGRQISARPEANLVAVSFLLYCIWDAIGLAIRNSDLYVKSPPSRDVPRRREVTWACTAIALVLTGAIWWNDPHEESAIVVVDLVLIALILLFRFAKELKFVTPDEAYRVDRTPKDQPRSNDPGTN